MDALLNIIENFGVAVGIMAWLLTVGNKTLAENTCKLQELEKAIFDSDKETVKTLSDFKEKVDDKIDDFIKKLLEKKVI